MTMTSKTPYLIRALYDWIIDNQCTPYIIVNTLIEGVSVPQDYVNPDGQIVLNISPIVVTDFSMDNEGLSFVARFGGVPTDIYIPCRSVLGIHTKENQQGMLFEHDMGPESPPPPPKPKIKKSTPKKRPSLKVVK